MPRAPRTAGPARAVPAPVVFMGSALSQYVGAGIAVGLFALMPSTAVAWWRVLAGAIALLAWRRPWRRHWTRRGLAVAAVFGIATATMNVIFYAAISRIPLGTAVPLEFLGPVAVAVLTGRGWVPRAAAGIALAGVALISGVSADLSDPVQRAGVLFAIGAGAAWAAYILLGRAVAAADAGLDSLALGMVCGAVAWAPFARGASTALASGRTLAEVIGVGILSTAVPYALEQVAMRRLDADAFALMSALLPATSMLVGLVMLHQVPGIAGIAGLVLISIAVALAGRSPSA